MNKDALAVTLRQLREQLNGINPVLSIYKKIKADIEKIEAQGIKVEIRKNRGIYKIEAANGNVIHVKEGIWKSKKLVKGPASFPCICSTRPQTCMVPGCEKKCTSKGKCPTCGKAKKRNYCKKHGTKDMPTI